MWRLLNWNNFCYYWLKMNFLINNDLIWYLSILYRLSLLLRMLMKLDLIWDSNLLVLSLLILNLSILINSNRANISYLSHLSWRIWPLDLIVSDKLLGMWRMSDVILILIRNYDISIYLNLPFIEMIFSFYQST